MEFKSEIMDESAVKRALIRISHEIIEKNKGTDNVVFLGIKTRGVPLAKILSQNIENFKMKTEKIRVVTMFGACNNSWIIIIGVNGWRYLPQIPDR